MLRGEHACDNSVQGISVRGMSVLNKNTVMIRTFLLFSMELWCVANVTAVRTWYRKTVSDIPHVKSYGDVRFQSLSGNRRLWIVFFRGSRQSHQANPGINASHCIILSYWQYHKIKLRKKVRAHRRNRSLAAWLLYICRCRKPWSWPIGAFMWEIMKGTYKIGVNWWEVA